MQSETQKNWNEFWGNKNPSPFHINKFILFIIIICITSAFIYFYNTDTVEDIPLTNSVNSSLYIQANKNGTVMAESISKIENILNNEIVGRSEDELLEHINTINALDLSEEYANFKKQVVQKINYYILYLNSKDTSYLDKYNSIDYITELSKAFDTAGVVYEINDGTITYHWQY